MDTVSEMIGVRLAKVWRSLWMIYLNSSSAVGCIRSKYPEIPENRTILIGVGEATGVENRDTAAAVQASANASVCP